MALGFVTRPVNSALAIPADKQNSDNYSIRQMVTMRCDPFAAGTVALKKIKSLVVQVAGGTHSAEIFVSANDISPSRVVASFQSR